MRPAEEIVIVAKARALEVDDPPTGNLRRGVLAGLLAAALGATIWAAITASTGYQMGFVAVGVGFLVGAAVKIAGRGADVRFGVVGAVSAFLGCALGNLLAISVLAANASQGSVLGTLGTLDTRLVGDLLVATFHPIDSIFYVIAVVEGFFFSFESAH